MKRYSNFGKYVIVTYQGADFAQRLKVDWTGTCEQYPHEGELWWSTRTKLIANCHHAGLMSAL